MDKSVICFVFWNFLGRHEVDKKTCGVIKMQNRIKTKQEIIL